MRRVTLAIALHALAAAPAGAVASWPPPVQLPGRAVAGPELGLDGRGDGVLAWTESSGGNGTLRVALRAPGAPFGAPLTISPVGQDVRAFALSSTPADRLALAWRAGREPDGRIVVALGRLGRGLADPQVLSGSAILPRAGRSGLQGLESAVPAVATGRGGWTIVAWLAHGPRGCGYVVRAAIRAPGGRFGAGRRISGACVGAVHPEVAITESGWGVVAWRQGTHPRIHAAVMSGGRFHPARRLSPDPATAAGPVAAVTFERIVVGWVAARGPVTAVELRGRARARPRPVSHGDQVFGAPRLAASAGGAVAAVWQTGRAGASAPIRFALSPGAGRPFGVPERVARRGIADARVEALRVALDRRADAVSTWCGSPLWSNVRRRDGVLLGGERIFAPVTGLTPEDPCAGGRDRVRLAVAADTGEVLLAWSRGPRLLVTRRPGPLG